jgi:hypothetical protein
MPIEGFEITVKGNPPELAWRSGRKFRMDRYGYLLRRVMAPICVEGAAAAGFVMHGSHHGPSSPISLLASSGPQLPGIRVEWRRVVKDMLHDPPLGINDVFASEQPGVTPSRHQAGVDRAAGMLRPARST